MCIKIKKAEIKDSDFLFFLKNDVDSRKNSLNLKKISKTEHEKWIKKKIVNDKTIILIAFKKKKKIGMVRYDLQDIVAYISINILKKFRNNGYGSIILKKSELHLKESTIIVAKVKYENKGSINIFKKNKYNLFLSKKKYALLIKILFK
jgi:RimJ/RimL family protein N-acetyltransferase